MSAQVGSAKLIFGSEKIANPFRFVLIADGYDKKEQELFAEDCRRFCEKLKIETWFWTLAPVIQVYAIAVIDSVSAGGFEASQWPQSYEQKGLTYFGAQFWGHPDNNILWCDGYALREMLESVFPKWDAALVLVNTELRGGSGEQRYFPYYGKKPVEISSVSARHSEMFNLALHELGHSTFGLADEYDAYRAQPTRGDQQRLDTLGFGESNISDSRLYERLPWKHLLKSDYPTISRQDMIHPSDSAYQAMEENRLGCYEGAKYREQGIWRPSFNCKMRSAEQPFCRACIDLILQRFRPHFQGRPAIATSDRLLWFMPGTTLLKFELCNVGSDSDQKVEILADVPGLTEKSKRSELFLKPMIGTEVTLERVSENAQFQGMARILWGDNATELEIRS